MVHREHPAPDATRVEARVTRTEAAMARPRWKPTLWGIPLVIHPSWLPATLVVLVAVTTSAPVAAGREGAVYTTGLVVAALLFLSVAAHEVAHALVARRCGLTVQRIRLFLFGGTTDLETGALSPRGEALSATAGPLASGVLALLFALLWWSARALDGLPAYALGLLALANASLFGLTLLPGYPLDGGRLIRALLWYLTDDLFAATRLVSLYGQFLGWCLIGGGLVLFSLRDNPAWGLVVLLGGWLLRLEARRGYHTLLWEALSRQIPAYQAAFLRAPRLAATRTLADVVEEVLGGLGTRNEGGPSLVVAPDGAVLGVLGLDELRAVGRARWPATTVDAAMAPRARLPSVPQSMPLGEVLALLPRRGPGYALVSGERGGEPVGVVTRARIERLLARRLHEGGRLSRRTPTDERRPTK